MPDLISEFLAHLASHGYRPRDGKIVADDQWHRVYYQEEKSTSGRYSLKIVDTDFAIASFGSEKDPVGFHRWSSKATRKLSKEERAAMKEHAARFKQERDEETMRQQLRVAVKLRPVLKRLKRATTEHDYLVAKGVLPHGVLYRAKGDELIVPVYQPDGMIWSLQRITAKGWKGFWRGGRVGGGYFTLAKKGDDLSTIIICEGFATGATIRQALGYPVIVAFNAGNLRPVAEAMRQKYPDARIVICADNDRWTFILGKVPAGIKPAAIDGTDLRWHEWREAGLLWIPGIDKAKQAAVAIGGAVVVWPAMPVTATGKPTDFNDLATLDGEEEVRKQILEALDVLRVEPGSEEHVEDGFAGPDYGGASMGDPVSDYVQTAGRSLPEFPFKILGHNEGLYYFFPKNSGQIFSAAATGLASIANLFRLAPLHYWDDTFNVSGKLSSRKIAELAANALIGVAHEAGVFRPTKIRGAGAWMDNGRPVIHCGAHLLVENRNVRPHDFESRYVYPLRNSTFPTDSTPMKSSEAGLLREICGQISWEDKLSGDLLAGWIVIAPFCGALEWRPHIWVEGESESGKSTVIDRIIRPLLDDVSMRFDGGTTEASIRQEMGVDALPVIYDEAEPENIKDRLIMDGLLLLARRASSGGRIGKGGANGQADIFNMRSCFCFAGINPAIKQRADESRISRLVIRRATFKGADEFYKKLKSRIRTTLTRDYGHRLIGRTLKNLPVLVANSEVFTDAAADVLTSRRAADQIGPMLAGLFLLTSSKPVTYEIAVEWIRKHEWTQHTAVAEQSDPERLITYISTSNVRYRGGNEMAIGTLISRALGLDGKDLVLNPDGDALSFLRSMGIWVKSDGVLFANKSPPLDRLLKDTPWISWSRPLMDIRGAQRVAPTKFATGLTSRAVLVPLEAFGL